MAKNSRRSSSRKTQNADIDQITPCPSLSSSTQADVSHKDIESRQPSRSPSPSSCSEIESATRGGSFESRRNSIKTLEEGTDGDPERLWKRMLVLQQIYGCYKSARMSAALELGDATFLLPSKACLDLMNEDMYELPDDVEMILKTSLPAQTSR